MEETKKKRRKNAFDRIVLTQASQKIIARFIDEIRDATEGMITLPGREVANFLIESRSQPLSKVELAGLRAKHFDESKAAAWIVSQIREANSNGETVQLDALIKKLQMRSVDVNRGSKRLSKPQKSETRDPSQINSDGAHEAHGVAVEPAPAAQSE